MGNDQHELDHIEILNVKLSEFLKEWSYSANYLLHFGEPKPKIKGWGGGKQS